MIYKFLEISHYNLISNRIYDYIVNNTDILDNAHTWHYLNHLDVLEKVPELKSALGQLNLTPCMMAIITCEPDSNVKVHIDSGPTTRFLWPIKNCNESFTKFYNVPQEHIVERKGPEGDTYFEITSLENSTFVDQINLTSPVVFTPKIPHGVWPNTRLGKRISLTIQFKESIDYMLA
jgi:hypothetical protein